MDDPGSMASRYRVRSLAVLGGEEIMWRGTDPRGSSERENEKTWKQLLLRPKLYTKTQTDGEF